METLNNKLAYCFPPSRINGTPIQNNIIQYNALLIFSSSGRKTTPAKEDETDIFSKSKSDRFTIPPKPFSVSGQCRSVFPCTPSDALSLP